MKIDEQVNKTEIISNEYIIEIINIEDINIPLRVKKNISSNLNDFLNHKIDTEINSFTKEKKFHNEVINYQNKNYNFNNEYVFDTAFTGIINVDNNYRIFLLYFLEKEEENIYIEIDVIFNIDVKDDINEIFLLTFKK